VIPTPLTACGVLFYRLIRLKENHPCGLFRVVIRKMDHITMITITKDCYKSRFCPYPCWVSATVDLKTSSRARVNVSVWARFAIRRWASGSRSSGDVHSNSGFQFLCP